ncbi:MAG TPA: ATP cone domain-containing protein [Candidatus Saccharimonadales bacterium]|nr:ATP cone domain-containing protein [Candidatus Saccharimonadales bacterium]
MVCIQCGGPTRVTNSRAQRRHNQVWRRRRCRRCGALFSTVESAEYGLAWTVRGKNGRLQPFSRDKLLLSLHRSCAHRMAPLKDAAGLTDTVINKLREYVEAGSLSSQTITEVAQVALQRFDKAASVHYVAFHPTPKR